MVRNSDPAFVNECCSLDSALSRSKLNDRNMLMLWVAASLEVKNMKFEFVIVRDGQLANVEIIVMLLLGQYCE